MDPAPTPDQCAAHQFLCDLRTRISTQPLPYQYGVEARALESLWEVFAQAREAMKRYPGCCQFADAVTRMLNVEVRPVTSKWNRAHAEGRLNSRDGAVAFREDLAVVQDRLRAFARELHVMAYGSACEDVVTPPVWTAPDLDACFDDLPFGLPKGIRNLPDEVVASINADEAAEIQRRRDAFGIARAAGMNAVGLALSGGGIRSASFSLGVTQVLADRGLLRDVDYLSTVSGGGYTGSFVTARLGTSATEADLAAPMGPDPGPIRYLRHHAKFLSAVNFKDTWSMITSTLAGMLLNWAAPVLVVVLAATGAVLWRSVIDDSFWLRALQVSGGLTLLTLVAYGGLLRGARSWASRGGWLLAASTALTAGIAACWLADKGYDQFNLWVDAGWKTPAGCGLIGALVAAGPAVFRFFPVLRNPRARQIALQLLLWAAGLVIPMLAVFLFFVCRRIGDLPGDPSAPVQSLSRYGGVGLLGCFAVMLALVTLWLLNINLTAPHRLYRDRLAKTFIHTRGRRDAPVPLAEVNASQRAPYHLLNTTLNLPSSEQPALRDRKCSFFLFSKHWTGSATTGYHRTREWKTNGQPVDLATVMAVSGAAASSHMGLGSVPTLTALLTALNIRLGFWIRRPDRRVWSEAPGFLCLLREMASLGMHEQATWLNLSDGGHLENLALYELLRRRCKFLICVDGEADPAYGFGGLMTLIRHARIDFGVRIEPRMDELQPDPVSRLSQAHALLCRVHYPAALDQPAAQGLLLYLKLSVTGNEPQLIQRYRALHPEFPHESTADQFFSEPQFEAYRQLGVHVAEGLFAPALINDRSQPESIPAWFRRLAGNLLEPQRT